MAVKFRVRPENSVSNIPVPFETERQREILIPNKDKLTLEDLYNKSRDIQSKCQDASVILTTPDTVHYDSDRDEFSFVTDEWSVTSVWKTPSSVTIQNHKCVTDWEYLYVSCRDYKVLVFMS